MSVYDKRLTVRELIEQLRHHDPDTLVLVNGYEGDLEAPTLVTTTAGRGEWGSHCGPWATTPDGEPALVLSREDQTHRIAEDNAEHAR